MHDILLKCIRNFGELSRKVPIRDRFTYYRVPRPGWLRSNPADKLITHFEHLGTLFSSGIVVWGRVVQANVMMFEEGDNDCPGDIVFSMTDPGHADPDYLTHVSQELYRLKGTEPTDDEMDRGMVVGVRG